MSQLIERMQHFVFPVSAADVQPSLGLSLRVDLDAPFRLYGVVVWNLGVVAGTGAEGQIALRIQRPDGRTIQRQITASNQLFPGNQYNQAGISPNKAFVCPIRPGVLFPAGSVIEMDIMGLDTGIADPTGTLVVFVGTNIYEKGNVWAPQYPPKWTARPYLDNLTVQNVAIPNGLPSLSNPFTAQADSDFVWQAGVYADVSISGVKATLTFFEPDLGNIDFTAVDAGVGGNSISVEIVVAGDNTPFSIVVTGTAIVINMGTNAGGAPIQTWVQVAELVNANPAASALVTSSSGTNANYGFTLGPTNLSGGSGGAGSPLSVDQLIDLGMIVRDPAYKGFSNTYIPVALLFPFLSGQAPGWLYPEIYVPRLTQLYFDLNYLYPGFTPAFSPVTIVLGMKGMKVYQQ